MHQDQFLQLAQWLLENRPTPAGLRSAVSRAYYSAFHTAKRFLEEMKVPLPKELQHQKIPRMLQASGDADIEATGRLLLDLLEHRKKADYELTKTEVEKESFVRLRLLDAETIIAVINTCALGKASASKRYADIKAAIQKQPV